MGSTKFTNPYAIEVIRTRKNELVGGISNTDDLLDLLVSNGVLQPESRIIVSRITAKEEKNSRMLNILESQGERACRIFFYPCLKSAEPDLYQNMKNYVEKLNENLKDTRRQLIGYLLEKDKGQVKNIKDTIKNDKNIKVKSRKTKLDSLDEPKELKSPVKLEDVSDVILNAVTKGDIFRLQELINGRNVNSKHGSSDTLLHLAAEHGQLAVVKFLLSQGAKLDLRNDQGQTALHRASERGQTAALVALLKAGSDIHAKDKSSKTPLHLAAQKGHEGTVRALVVEETKGFRNQTRFLHMAAMEDNAALADILLRNGASVDARDPQRKTALFHAISRGNEKTVAVFLKAGARFDSEMIEVVFQLNRKSMLSLILKNIKTAMSPHEVKSALFRAVQRNLDGIVAALIDSGIDVNIRNDHGYTPLLLAAEMSNVEVFKVLVSKKAQLDMRLPNHTSALHLAAQSGNMVITEVCR